MFTLRFDLQEIHTLASRYPIADDQAVQMSIAPQVRARGYFTQPEFVTICHWKTPRSQPKVASNPESFIQAVAQTALSI